MSHNSEMLANIKELNNLLIGVATVEDLLAHSAAFLARALKLDLVSILVNHKGQEFAFEYDSIKGSGNAQAHTTLKFESGQVVIDDHPIQLPCYVKRASVSQLTRFLERQDLAGLKSFCIVPILHLGVLVGWIECQTVSVWHPWTSSQRVALNKVAALLAGALEHSWPAKTSEPDDALISDSATVESSTPWVILDVLNDARILRSSKGLASLTGIAPELARVGSIFDFLDRILIQADKDVALRAIKAVLQESEQRADFYANIVHAETRAVRSFRFQAERSWLKSKRITVIISDLTDQPAEKRNLADAKLRSMRLVEYGNLIIIRTDLQLGILDILGDTTRIFGVPSEELINKPAIWNRLLHSDDFRRLALKMRAMGDRPIEFEHEIKITNEAQESARYLFLTAIPIFSATGQHIGWEGYGVDITEKRGTEDEIKRQNRRIQALYEIARTMQSNIDPAFVALRGLKALMSATKSVFGHCVVYDRRTDTLEVLATVGCDAEYVKGLTEVMNKPNLSRDAISANQGMLIEDLRTYPRARYGIAARAGARACIVMPLSYEDPEEGQVVIGALQIANRRVGKFTQEDYELAAAAAAQMATSIRQADYNAIEKREASSLATLYRLSHSLAKVQSLEEIGEQVFPIIMSEVACRRIWLGVLNEQGTHIAGVGAYGPGLNDRIAKIQIELSLQHDYIDQVIKTRRAVLVPAGAQMECSALNSLIARLKPNAMVIVPLVVLGRVVGIIILEPTIASSGFLSRKLSLLLSMANEMATVVLTRRLESKMAAAEKMRMAGLLASGVAHNFNNLLQAVLGQASLLSMQLPEDSPLKSSVESITDAAQRGAELIKKMLWLSENEAESRKEFDPAEFIKTNFDLFSSLLGRNIELKLEIEQELPTLIADSKQLQQVLSSLIVNARDALKDKQDRVVTLRLSSKRLRTAEIDPELAPGEYVVVTVSDNGQGMDSEQLQRCFEPFYSSKNVDQRTGVAFDGSGFGLSLSYSIIRQHAGLILVNSQVGKGTEFTIYLPATIRSTDQVAQTLKVEKMKITEGQLQLSSRPDNISKVAEQQKVVSEKNE